MEEIEKKLTLTTISGCKRLLAICICVILLFSFFAHLVSTKSGTIKVSRVTFDARGATMDAELYYPVGTTDEDKLPAVIVTHGAGCTLDVTKGIAQELARRGFVVLNVSGYGAGLSEFPANDEVGAGEKKYNARETPGGLWDALNFVRTLKFVDQTRIGMTGHSQGSRRTSYAATLDCGYLTFNDIMVNVLYDIFGQTFNEDEININADTLARDRLNSDQLKFYDSLKKEYRLSFDTMLKSLCLIGGDAVLISPIRTVTVGGYEVQRNCQVNLGLVIGDYDFGYVDYISRDTTKASWHTNTNVTPREWYAINDTAKTSTKLGNFFSTNIAGNSAFEQAVYNRSIRVICFNPETHSRNFFSNNTTRDIVKFFEQTLSYNNGELTSASTVPIGCEKIIFMWRELLNCIAMFAMLAMLMPLAGLLFKTKFFASCIAERTVNDSTAISKKKFLIISGFTVVLSFIAMYYSNSLQTPFLPFSRFLPLWTSWWHPFVYLIIVGAASIIMLAIFWFMDKKNQGSSGLMVLNIKMKPANILKTILASVILLAAAYLSLIVIVYLFNENYQLWVVIFTEMKVEYWGLVWRYYILFFPLLLLVGAVANYTIRKDIPEWKDNLITVVINSLGVWILWLISYLVLHSGGATFSSFNSSYAMLLLVPITFYITRKMYKITNSIWLGASINALLICWTLISSVGYHTYIPQSFFSSFFNL